MSPMPEDQSLPFEPPPGTIMPPPDPSPPGFDMPTNTPEERKARRQAKAEHFAMVYGEAPSIEELINADPTLGPRSREYVPPDVDTLNYSMMTFHEFAGAAVEALNHAERANNEGAARHSAHYNKRAQVLATLATAYAPHEWVYTASDYNR